MNRWADRERGFTLLEVLVAFAVLALCLAVLVQVFQSGLRGATLSAEHAQALALAQSLLVEAGRGGELTAGERHGTWERHYAWRRTVRPAAWADEEAIERAGLRPYEVLAEVSWNEGAARRVLALDLVLLKPVEDR